jgi:type I restriction enzyme M protein
MTYITEIHDISAVLRAIRANLDLTQEELAEKLGVAFATVNRWEGGVTKPQKAAQEAISALAADAEIDIAEVASEPVEAAAQVTRRRRVSKAPSTKTMEQMLWDAACSIRGEKDAAKFKDYLLPLLFLKRLSDVFDDEIERLAEEYADQETALEIAEIDHGLLRFYIPPEARWAVINGRESYEWPDEQGRSTRPKDIGEHLTRSVRAIVRHNPSLSDVIDLEDFAAERNGERDINPAKLTEVVETFSDPRYRLGLADVQPDFLGRAYEFLLRKFAEGSGQSAGEFFTPTEVGLLMAHIMRPRPGEECHDYACGSAGLLVKLQLIARELDPISNVPLKLYGQELQAESYAVAKMNAIIHDMETEIERGDTMINPKFKTADSKIRTYDIVVANPMWNQPFNPDIFADDPFDRFRTQGGVTTGKGDWAWLQHTLTCLNERGRAAVVLDTGAVTRGSGSKNEDRERNIRKWFVEHDLIDGVILLPNNLFYNTSAAGVIIVLSKRKPAARKDKIVLLNASQHVRKGRPKNYIPEEDLRLLAAAYLKGEPVEGEIAVITREQVEEADYNLSPSRWVGINEELSLESIPSLLEELRLLNNRDTKLTNNIFKILASFIEEKNG